MNSNLTEYRKSINECDKKIIELFKQRMNLVSKVAEYKLKNNIEVLDSNREAQLLENNVKLLDDKSLEEFYKKVLKSIIEVSKEYQNDIIKKRSC
ncbi:MAG: chorismate mutase [Anaeroplasmataceae bacterium]